MADEFTRGPWRVTVGYQVPPAFTNFRVEEHTHVEVVTLDEDGEPIPHGQTDFTYTLANARLIAAAPDLLWACRSALRALSAATSGTMHGVEDEVAEIRAALDLAAGVTPGTAG